MYYTSIVIYFQVYRNHKLASNVKINGRDWFIIIRPTVFLFDPFYRDKNSKSIFEKGIFNFYCIFGLKVLKNCLYDVSNGEHTYTFDGGKANHKQNVLIITARDVPLSIAAAAPTLPFSRSSKSSWTIAVGSRLIQWNPTKSRRARGCRSSR